MSLPVPVADRPTITPEDAAVLDVLLESLETPPPCDCHLDEALTVPCPDPAVVLVVFDPCGDSSAYCETHRESMLLVMAAHLDRGELFCRGERSRQHARPVRIVGYREVPLS